MANQERASLLRGTLFGNALFSSLCGLAFLVAGQVLGNAFGLAAPEIEVFGLVLLGFAAYLFLVARRRPLRGGEGWFVWILDVGYVLASVAVLTASPQLLSSTGRLFFWVAADVVAVFAVLEYVGLRRLAPPVGEGRGGRGTKGEVLGSVR